MVITTGKTGRRRLASVHRIVAGALSPKAYGLPEVNHIDCDRTNNRVDNLEWCTHIDNVHYSIKMGNHICTTDISGANNPNFGNDALKKKYAANPWLAKENNSRPGVKNGRCRKVKLINIENGKEMSFDYTRQAAQYLMDNEFVRAKKIDSVSNRITLSIKKNEVFYQKFKAEFID